MNKRLTSVICTLIFGGLYYYFILPPINITSFDFWFFITVLTIIYLISSISIREKLNIINLNSHNIKIFPKDGIIISTSIMIIILVIIVINILLSPFFNSKAYANRIKVDETRNFITDIEKVNFNALPIIDKDSSQKLGDRVMGQMPELVSQFDVSNLYTQINFNNEIIRVTPLEYSDFFKYLSNRKEGIKGYISVNSVTGEAKLTKLEKGLKYMDSAIFGEDLNRKLRFTYPTKIFGEKNFEIDNDGNPYWIIPTIKYNGVNIRKEINGLIIFNPINGESKLYDVNEVPSWVDHVYSSDLIIEQVDDWGKYRGGFLNSIFGQKNVVATTEGYNYTVMNDDVYLYTGITSAVADESNIGFILTNMRTKETKYYSVPGAEEYSAMASAEGQVQQMKYKATFPLLINLNNKPTYFISLKDNAGLVKMYAFVDVADYQKVTVTDSSKGIIEAANNYIGGNIIIDNEEIIYETIKIKNINTAIINGNSYYYITDTDNNKYVVPINIDSKNLPFLNIDDNIKIGYIKKEEVTEIRKIEIIR